MPGKLEVVVKLGDVGTRHFVGDDVMLGDSYGEAGDEDVTFRYSYGQIGQSCAPATVTAWIETADEAVAEDACGAGQEAVDERSPPSGALRASREIDTDDGCANNTATPVAVELVLE